MIHGAQGFAPWAYFQDTATYAFPPPPASADFTAASSFWLADWDGMAEQLWEGGVAAFYDASWDVEQIDWEGTLDGVQIFLDVAGFVPGFGEVADGANAVISLARGDYAGAALSAGSMIPLLGDAVAKPFKFARWGIKYGDKVAVVGKLDELSETIANVADDVEEIFSQCFPAGTPVSTESGHKPIEQVAVGETVWGFSLSAGSWQLRPVLRTFTFEYDGDLVEIAIPGETISSTIGHPFWVIEGDDLSSRPVPPHIARILQDDDDSAAPGRWVDSQDLRAGDVLLLKDRPPVRVAAVNLRPFSGTVYNFAVDDVHTYAVGHSAVLVHNTCNFRNKGDAALFQPLWLRLNPSLAVRAGARSTPDPGASPSVPAIACCRTGCCGGWRGGRLSPRRPSVHG